MNCQIQTLRVRTFHIICQIVFVKIMTKLIAWSHQICQSLAPSMMMISNLEYRYTYILVKIILVPRRQSSQDWTITKRTMCFQRAASRWTFGTSREPVQSAPSPGAWTASAASASTLCRSVWLPSQDFVSADFESACVPVYLLDQLLQQTELLASCASDRSVILYDMRESTPLKKVGHC